MTTPTPRPAPGVVPYREPGDLPALFRAADRTADEAQARFLLLTRLRLAGLLVAAAGGAVGIRIWGIPVAAWVALLAFTAALASELMLALTRPERAWYEGRAAAESTKTLAWRYMVRGEPFHANPADTTDADFVADLSNLLEDLNDIDLAVIASDDSQITPVMRAARALSFEDRRDHYLRERVQAQRRWYVEKSSQNQRDARVWTIVGVVAEFTGVVAAAFMAFDYTDLDLLGLLAAIAATAAAWSQAKQHRSLATAYAVTALELASVASAAAITKDADWARFVDEAEEAISREHTLWRASRGVRRRRSSSL